MATWSLCGRHAGPDNSPTPVLPHRDYLLSLHFKQSGYLDQYGATDGPCCGRFWNGP